MGISVIDGIGGSGIGGSGIGGAGVSAGSAFSPLSLFANGEQGSWYDPSDLATLYQDSVGTIPVTGDGDPVGLMLDKSGNDNHASQASSGLRPIYRTDGTLHWLESDGVDDYIQSNAGSITPQPTTQVCGFQAITLQDGVNIYNGVTASSVQYLVNSSGSFRFSAGTESVIGSSDLNAHVTNLLYNGASSLARYDGVVGSTVNVGANGWEGNTFFANRIFGGNSNIRLFGHITVCREMTDQERASTDVYMADKSGVTL